MKSGILPLLVLGAAAAAASVAWPARGVEPPLPGQERQLPPPDAFLPLLKPGEELPPGTEAPVMPDDPTVAPPLLFPDNLPGAGGVDGLPLADQLLPPPSGGAGGQASLPGGALLPPPSHVPGSGLVETPGLELAAQVYWHRSPREAREIARRERKPLLIFFRQKWKGAPMLGVEEKLSDPNISINDDLLSTEDFKQAMAGRVVLTSLFYPIGSPNKDDYPPEKLAALQKFKDFFKVKGFPTVILLDENGREIERINGYSRMKLRTQGVEVSTAPPLLEKLKLAVDRREAVVHAEQERLKRLTAQNYREWTSAAGSKIMAKLISASADEVVLMDDSGAIRRVHPLQLHILERARISRDSGRKQQASTP